MRDEHYCLNCEATLDDQSGFSPDLDYWTCMECGERTYNPDIYSGDRFEGVYWHCDDCGALLNTQYAFTDLEDTWVCEVCGHENTISKDEIDNNCSNSSVSVNNGGSRGALLRNSVSISRSVNGILDIIASICNDGNDDDIDDDDNNNKKLPYPLSPPYRARLINDRQLKKIRRKAFIFKRKKIQIGYDASALILENIEEILVLLYNKGFKNISTITVNDVYVGSRYKEGDITVAIDGVTSFRASKFVPYDADVVIKCHKNREITVPFSADSLKKKKYTDVYSDLDALGFANIVMTPKKDLVTGWVTKNGSVEKVTIGSDSAFPRNSKFKYDTKITIEYHTFR